jgi:hypothetical protein
MTLVTTVTENDLGDHGHGRTQQVRVNVVPRRVSSKQTKINFGSNRNKPKQDLFRVCFGLFRETKTKIFRFVSVFRTYIETAETNRTVL